MAITKVGSTAYTITTNDNGSQLELGPPSAANRTGLLMIQFEAVGFTGSIAVKARTQGLDAETLAMTLQPIPYRKYNTGGLVGDLTVASAAITGSGIILVPASGLSVFLDVTATAGTCKVTVVRLTGAADV